MMRKCGIENVTVTGKMEGKRVSGRQRYKLSDNISRWRNCKDTWPWLGERQEIEMNGGPWELMSAADKVLEKEEDSIVMKNY